MIADNLPARRLELACEPLSPRGPLTVGPCQQLPPTAALRTIRAILADPDLTPAQARVVAAVVCQADSATGRAWSSFRQLKRDFHVGASQIAAALQKTAGRYLEKSATGARGATQYRILLPPAAEPSAPATGAPAVASAPAIGAQSPAAEPPSAPAIGALPVSALPNRDSSAPATGTILSPYSGEEEEPPYPPEGGVCLDSHSDSDSGFEIADDPPAWLAETTDAAIARIAAAYCAVFGNPPPARWNRKVRRGWSNGDRPWLARLDADAIRGGLALTTGSPLRIFGLGWVHKHLEARAATARIAAANAESAEAAREATEAAEATRNADTIRAAAGQLCRFRALDPATRREWTAAATQRPYAPKDPNRLELFTAALFARTAGSVAGSPEPVAGEEETAPAGAIHGVTT